MATKAPVPAAKLPDATAKSGNICSLACNLPHGLTIIHADKKLVVHGANHPRALHTSHKVSGKWGITHNVDEDWFDNWVEEVGHPAVINGLILKNTSNKIEQVAEAAGDAITNGVDKIDPSKLKETDGVSTRTDKDDDGED